MWLAQIHRVIHPPTSDDPENGMSNERLKYQGILRVKKKKKKSRDTARAQRGLGVKSVPGWIDSS